MRIFQKDTEAEENALLPDDEGMIYWSEWAAVSRGLGRDSVLTETDVMKGDRFVLLIDRHEGESLEIHFTRSEMAKVVSQFLELDAKRL